MHQTTPPGRAPPSGEAAAHKSGQILHLLEITHSPGFPSGHKVFQLPETWAHLQTLHLT
jgi:hypothetical protein